MLAMREGFGPWLHQQLCRDFPPQHRCCYAGQTWQSLAVRAQLPAAGQGRSRQSNTALIYAAALSPKASEGSSLYRNPTKTQTHTAHSPAREPCCRALRAWEKAVCRWDHRWERENQQLLCPLLCQLPEPGGCHRGRTLPTGATHGQNQRSCSAAPTAFPSHARARSKAGGCGRHPPTPLLHSHGELQG